MDPSMRVVMRMPVSELWDSGGNPTAVKRRTLGGSDIAAMLRQDRVRFVVANCGDPLRWVPPFECYEFWKTEVKPRVVERDRFYLEDFPGEYCYVASEWTDGQPFSIVLLEKHH